MNSTVIIVIDVVVIIGLAGIVLGPFVSSNSGGKVQSAFSQAYSQEFGSAPPEDAEKAIATGSMVIFNAIGGGHYDLPSQNLDACIQDYASAVGRNEAKMELGLGCLLAICCNKEGKASPGCRWAIEVITGNMARYCPTMMSRVFGF